MNERGDADLAAMQKILDWDGISEPSDAFLEAQRFLEDTTSDRKYPSCEGDEEQRATKHETYYFHDGARYDVEASFASGSAEHAFVRSLMEEARRVDARMAELNNELDMRRAPSSAQLPAVTVGDLRRALEGAGDHLPIYLVDRRCMGCCGGGWEPVLWIEGRTRLGGDGEPNADGHFEVFALDSEVPQEPPV